MDGSQTHQRRAFRLHSGTRIYTAGEISMTTHSAKQITGVALLLGATAIFSLLAGPAQAAMRCGSKLVTNGDHKVEVLHKCGEPVLKEYRGFRYQSYPPYHSHGLHSVIGADVEEWTYNFGPRRFMRLVRFANSKVERVIVLDYGY